MLTTLLSPDIPNAAIIENAISTANIDEAKGYAVVELTSKANVKILSVQSIVLAHKELTAGKNSIVLAAPGIRTHLVSSQQTLTTVQH